MTFIVQVFFRLDMILTLGGARSGGSTSDWQDTFQLERGIGWSKASQYAHLE